MDFQSLTRKELQTLCKKNKIPANMTNMAMADALKALNNVEGIEEIIKNPHVSEPTESLLESPLKKKTHSPDLPRTCRRTSTRRKPNKDAVVPVENEPESSQPCTRSRPGTRKIFKQDEEQQKKERDSSNGSKILETPMTQNRRKRMTRGSVHVEGDQAEGKDEGPKKNQSRVYSTRRSTRLSGKSASESVQMKRGGGRTEVIKINALSEEDSDEIRKESKDEIQENKVVVGDEVCGFGLLKSEIHKPRDSDSIANKDPSSEDGASRVVTIEVMDLDLDSSASPESAVEDLNGGCVKNEKLIPDEWRFAAGNGSSEIEESSLNQEIFDFKPMEDAVQECLTSMEHKESNVDSEADQQDTDSTRLDGQMSGNIHLVSEKAGKNPSQIITSIEHKKSDPDSEAYLKDVDQMESLAFLEGKMSGNNSRCRTEKASKKSRPEELMMTCMNLCPTKNPELLACEQDAADQLVRAPNEVPLDDTKLEIENTLTDPSSVKCEAVIDHDSDLAFSIQGEDTADLFFDPISILKVMKTDVCPPLLDLASMDSNVSSDVPSSISTESKESGTKIASFFAENHNADVVALDVADHDVAAEDNVVSPDVADHNVAAEDNANAATDNTLIPASGFAEASECHPLLEETQISKEDDGTSDLHFSISIEFVDVAADHDVAAKDNAAAATDNTPIPTSEFAEASECHPLLEEETQISEADDTSDFSFSISNEFNECEEPDNAAAATDNTLIPASEFADSTSECLHPLLEETQISKDDGTSDLPFSISIEFEKPANEMTSFFTGGSPKPEIANIIISPEEDGGEEDTVVAVAATAASASLKPTSPCALNSNLDIVIKTKCSSLDADHIPNQVSMSLMTPINGEFHTQVTPRKSSAKKSTPLRKVIPILKDNKENIDNSGRKQEYSIDVGKMTTKQLIMTEKGNNKRSVFSETSKEDGTMKSPSLRQLRKMFRDKLQIIESKNNKVVIKEQQEVEGTRTALQPLKEMNEMKAD